MLKITLAKDVPVTLAIERIVQTTTAPIVTLLSFVLFVIVDFMAITVLIITAKRIFVKHKTCLKCHAKYNVIKGKRHRCGIPACLSCKEMVDIHAHKCFIQPHFDEPEQQQEDEEGKKNPSLNRCLSMPTLRPWGCQTDSLSPTCCVIATMKVQPL